MYKMFTIQILVFTFCLIFKKVLILKADIYHFEGGWPVVIRSAANLHIMEHLLPSVLFFSNGPFLFLLFLSDQSEDMLPVFFKVQ